MGRTPSPHAYKWKQARSSRTTKLASRCAVPSSCTGPVAGEPHGTRMYGAARHSHVLVFLLDSPPLLSNNPSLPRPAPEPHLLLRASAHLATAPRAWAATLHEGTELSYTPSSVPSRGELLSYSPFQVPWKTTRGG